jgi:hypothetical protein
LGCPQALCLSGGIDTIDTIYKRYDSKKFILRGRHHYLLDKPVKNGQMMFNLLEGYYDASLQTAMVWHFLSMSV